MKGKSKKGDKKKVISLANLFRLMAILALRIMKNKLRKLCGLQLRILGVNSHGIVQIISWKVEALMSVSCELIGLRGSHVSLI